MNDLIHYTCIHSLDGIRADGALRPMPPLGYLPVPLVWLTDDPDATYASLGFTQPAASLSRCDRMAVRLEVAAPHAMHAVPWAQFAREWCGATDVGAIYRLLAAAEGAKPRTWWVSQVPIVVALENDL